MIYYYGVVQIHVCIINDFKRVSSLRKGGVKMKINVCCAAGKINKFHNPHFYDARTLMPDCFYPPRKINCSTLKEDAKYCSFIGDKFRFYCI